MIEKLQMTMIMLSRVFRARKYLILMMIDSFYGIFNVGRELAMCSKSVWELESGKAGRIRFADFLYYVWLFR